MRWIDTEAEFKRARLDANTVKYTDSRRIRTDLQLWTFQDVDLISLDFGRLLQNLLELSHDPYAAYVVLVPDPIWYFYHHFRKYPAVHIEAGDSAERYLSVLNEDPGGSPADAIGINWWELAVVPPSRAWFVHALRHDEPNGAHLWIPDNWVSNVLVRFPYLTRLAD